MKTSLVNLLALLVLLPQFSSSYNILLLVPFPGPSHWMWFQQFIAELLNREHHITVVTSYPTKHLHANCTSIVIDPMFDVPKLFPTRNFFTTDLVSDFQKLGVWWELGIQTSEYALNNAKVKELIESDQHFDLVILEQFFQESFLMFAHKFKAPIVTMATLGTADNMDHAMGLITPLSIIPHLLLPYSDNMSFKQRAYNTYLSIYDYVIRRWHYMPKMQEMAERHFKDHIMGPLPSVRDLEKHISVMLINSHRSIDTPRPSIAGMVNVGGCHIKPAKPLPTDILEFVNKSKHGVVYFTLGSYIKSADMPTDKLKILLKAFSQLKQNVLWKYEDDTLKNLPKNVMIKKWMPQNDILAHPKVILFITHSGLFSTQESIHWGVPMLCIPLFSDQHRNTIKSVREGYALSMDISTMTDSEVVTKITTLIEKPQYIKRAKEVSALFRDNPIHPMDEAVFWIEYVVRNKGASRLKSYGVHVPFYRYILLDVFLVVLSVGFICAMLLYKVFKCVTLFVSSNKIKKRLKKIKNKIE